MVNYLKKKCFNISRKKLSPIKIRKTYDKTRSFTWKVVWPYKKHMALICFLFLLVFLFYQYVLLSSYLPFFSSYCHLLDLNKKSINRKKLTVKSKFDNKIYRWRYNGNSLFVLFWFVSHYSLTLIEPFMYLEILFIDTGDFFLNYHRKVF